MKNKQKKVFTELLIGFSLILVLLPFTVTFNDVLTRIVEKNILYGWIQANMVPAEAKIMGAMFVPLGYKFAFSPTNSILSINGINMQITWNCLGWQSLVLLLVSFLAGFRGKYRIGSVVEAAVIGILGTFWINILRMFTTVFLAVNSMPLFRVVFHDYLAAFTSVVWLFFFWWFVYKFVLQEKEVEIKQFRKIEQ